MNTFGIRIKVNWKPICKSTAKIVAVFYTLCGFVFLFVSPADCFDNETSWWCKLLWGVLAFIIVVIIAFLLSVYRNLKSTHTDILVSNSNHSVMIQFGDMYSPNIIRDGYDDRINIVIPVNRCFDTIVNDSLVSHKTQHGRVMQKLYDDGIYDENTLSDAIQKSLLTVLSKEKLTKAQKPEGNLERYPCGTVAEVKVSDKLTYFFLGLSQFDEHLKASTTKAEFAEAIQKMIEFCNDRSQGYPVVLPLMGTGLSRTNIPATEILKYMVSAFRINKDIINCDFHIVVWEGMKDKVSIKDI